MLHEIKPQSFLFVQPQALPAVICDNLVARFEQQASEQYKGLVGGERLNVQNLKKTTDLFISGSDKAHWQDADYNLHRSLALALRELREQFPYFKGNFKDMGYNLQRYCAGDYYHWHIDADSMALAARQLVALWYLNDVPEAAGGSTDFIHQRLSIQPEQGKLVLFPPFWTHEHRAAPLVTGVKYIATTWLVFA